ncbi:similar to Saccharomyces cerevisiae YLR130C ZRT2 Low-affinity zinc transporter of the plasma membrane [Maudiozyma saulgeensis]|uniref:Similar to Saccharomyces cerevisiae YLR130C ZRT2 Low-affinity zinc transporter of the plasma membrane n=1 Tax=Maudiozyma saulgeensis TaxID=1789683 RepID=A0A1X7R4U8_9SACH|nr:similar to Saccharomyces cerevisiae YLR130C ZRT2 Low-affinity zinc transporter of the plasma membrane [Kazachstania saulgeensis]
MIDLVARDSPTDTCQTVSEYNGHQNLRILAVFIIMISSGLGVYFPILSSRYSFIRLPDWCFFIAKFFGSGVIVATAFIHLLQPAAEALDDDCLGGTFAEYPWAFGICLMSLFLLFFTEIVTHYYVTKAMGGDPHDHEAMIDHDDSSSHDESLDISASSNLNDTVNSNPNNIEVFYNREVSNIDGTHNHYDDSKNNNRNSADVSILKKEQYTEHNYEYNQNIDKETGDFDDYKLDLESGMNIPTLPSQKPLSKLVSVPGKDHFGHDDDHQDVSQIGTPVNQKEREQYLNQIFSVTILEFGIIFHSVFVGLSLSVSGEEFETLFIVLTFHQMFEGLGLGTRIAETPWPNSRRFTPWIMGLAFTLTSPIAAAIGIGVRNSFLPGSRTALITNGVFDSISSGILIYTGLVELMAHEFLYSNQFKGPEGFKRMLCAYFIMCCGAALMALLGKWA